MDKELQKSSEGEAQSTTKELNRGVMAQKFRAMNPIVSIPKAIGEFREMSREERKHKLRFLNLSYHYHKAIDDAKASIEVIRNWHYEDIRDDPVELARAFRGKLFAVFFLSGPFALLSMFLGTALQYGFRNPWIGLFSSLICAQIFSTAAYQFIWFTTNNPLYRDHSPHLGEQLLQMLRDIGPAQWRGFKYVATSWLISVPLNSGVILLLEHFLHEGAFIVPIPVVAGAIEGLLIQTTLIRIMGELFDKQSHVLAARYCRKPSVTC